jgi:LmbE family N-acetylglucosaminyl deacetylase
MAEKASRGIPVSVAVATDGRRGWHSPTPRPTPGDIAEIRHHEWHRALDALGVPRADRYELGFPDGELDDHESELAARIEDLLRSVRPSQVFVTRPGDPHPDHLTLVRAVRQVLAQMYDSGPDSPHGGVKDVPGPGPVGLRPQVFTYRVYPGEGLWPDDRPARVTAAAAAAQFVRSVLGLADRRALLLRAARSMSTKCAAIDAYDSQCRLLGGELSFVWGTSVELYWPLDQHGLRAAPGPSELSN